MTALFIGIISGAFHVTAYNRLCKKYIYRNNLTAFIFAVITVSNTLLINYLIERI